MELLIIKARAKFNAWFGRPSPRDLAKRELENAKRQLLEHLTHQEYYDHQVKFEKVRIARLEKYILGESK